MRIQERGEIKRSKARRNLGRCSRLCVAGPAPPAQPGADGGTGAGPNLRGEELKRNITSGTISSPPLDREVEESLALKGGGDVARLFIDLVHSQLIASINRK